ncbi:pyridoxal phosphate (PLP)-dependent transferases superfamily protein [Tasmannia lanceolata]|uniref:pyridoxal phosphate (PLP)-dependent transferases superfamily protein n=1 Tax=Tasmannia lanceolata TaxID=3420 RepID=UPI0040649F40
MKRGAFIISKRYGRLLAVYLRILLARSSSLLSPRIGSQIQMENVLKPMDAEQLRENAHKMVDFIADYYKSIENFPVRSQVQPGYLHELLPDSAPNHPEPLQDVLDDVRQKILPGVTHWQSPDYFAYFPSNSSTAGFLGEMLSAGFNIVGFSWITSPAATELEIIVLDWLAKMLKLPKHFLSVGQGGGVIQGTASEAVLVVLLAARDRVLRSVGKNSIGKLTVYASDQAHSALQKACQIAGIHPENYRLLKTDSSTDYALSPNVLYEAISDDISAGLIPLFLCATVGTTSSTAVDPLPALGKIAKGYGMWFHVDAAYAGSACICPEYRHYIDGLEEADSFNMNAHKWFLTNFDCSVLWVKDRNALIQSLSTNPEFLKNKASEANTVVDYKDWQIPLGRRFRSLKLWMVLRLYGLENLQSHIRNHIRLAEQFEELVVADPRFEVVVPRTFSLVCFRLLSSPDDQDNGNRLNHNLLEAVNSSGKIFISHTVLSGKFILRFVVGAPLTEERHVKAAWKVLQDQATILLGSPGSIE